MDECQIFARALMLTTSAERAAYLDAVCAANPQQRAEVEALLQAHACDPGFLEQSVGSIMDTVNSPPGTTGDGSLEIEGSDDLCFLTPSARTDSLGRLGNYEVLEVIGRGGMGIVLRAFDEKLHRVVAIKVMAAQLAANATARKRFVREAQKAAAVSHDHLVTIHAVEDSGSIPYLVMYYVAGQSLQQRLDQTGPLQLHEILRIGRQTAAGLAAAHAQGIVHRDIKPANLLLENGVERVKITDFGLARAANDAQLTHQSMVAGTPSYMAPEQARGEAVDHRADLFSLGSVLYAMATGRAPFRGETTLGVLKRVCDDTPPPIRESNPDIPDDLVAVIAKLHAKDPADRYQSADEVAAVLGQLLAHVQHPSIATQPGRSHAPSEGRLAPRVAHRGRWALAAAALLLLLGGLSLSEATGVTRLGETVIRIITPDGTLIVETSDTDVKVTVEGNGDLIIAGAGLNEVRLRPGSYKVSATKDGKRVPLDRDIVTISRGGEEVVKVRVESAEPAQVAGEIRSFDVHWGQVVSVAFSPDGRRVAYGGEDATVWLCDVATGKELQQFTGHESQVLSVAFSSDGRRLVSGGQDTTMRLWDVETGKELRCFRGHTASICCVALSPDGRYALSGSGWLTKDGKFPGLDHTARLWDVETGEELRRFPGHKAWVTSVAFSPDGNRALTGCGNADPIIRLWKVETGEELGRLEGHSSGGNKVVFSNDGSQALSASADRTVRLWDLASGEQLQLFHGHRRDVTGVAFLPDGKRIISSSWDQTVRLWSLDTGAELDRLEGHTGSIRSLAASVDGRQAVTGAEDGTVRLWQIPEVTVTRESADPIGSPASAQAESEAFVLQGGKGVPERKFNTLARAGAAARDGDTIEIRGNGPFICQPIQIRASPLTIRAGHGFRPVIQQDVKHVQAGDAMLKTDKTLCLEGIELHVMGPPLKEGRPWPILVHGIGRNARLFVAHCRFLGNEANGLPIHADEAASLEVRNSEVLTQACIVYSPAGHSRLVLHDNLIVAGLFGIRLDLFRPDVKHVVLEFGQNTLVAPILLQCYLNFMPEAFEETTQQAVKPIRIQTSGNLFDGAQSILRFEQSAEFLQDNRQLSVTEMESLLRAMVGWRGERNVISARIRPFDPAAQGMALRPTQPSRTIADWNAFWGLTETQCIQGRIRYVGGNLLDRRWVDPQALGPEDYRLRPDSTGYQAGPEGKDLGADVDLVGPGQAYERWQKKPEYQEWLKASEQVK